MQSSKLTILASAALVRGAEATEFPDASFLYFATGVFTVGAIIGFLMGIIVMMCLKSEKKEESSPKEQNYLPVPAPTETKPKEQDYLQDDSESYGFNSTAFKGDQCLVTKGGYEKTPIGTYHTMMCRAMYLKE